VILEGVGGDGHGEERPPLGEDAGLEVEDDRNERPDLLDGGGLRPEWASGWGAAGSGSMERQEVDGGRLEVGRRLGLRRRRSGSDRMCLG
jgi:hypothetical protein